MSFERSGAELPEDPIQEIFEIAARIPFSWGETGEQARSDYLTLMKNHGYSEAEAREYLFELLSRKPGVRHNETE